MVFQNVDIFIERCEATCLDSFPGHGKFIHTPAVGVQAEGLGKAVREEENRDGFCWPSGLWRRLGLWHFRCLCGAARAVLRKTFWSSLAMWMWIALRMSTPHPKGCSFGFHHDCFGCASVLLRLERFPQLRSRPWPRVGPSSKATWSGEFSCEGVQFPAAKAEAPCLQAWSCRATR